jgi:L-rhamnose mutarotase
MKFKRYCKTLTLQNNNELIQKYIEVHGIGRAWPEILQGMNEVGIIDMEIYIHENQLFMIMDTITDFDHDKAMNNLAKKPRQAEWEKFVSQFQNTSESASAKDKWQLIERIFELDQKESYKAIDGQLKEL